MSLEHTTVFVEELHCMDMKTAVAQARSRVQTHLAKLSEEHSGFVFWGKGAMVFCNVIVDKTHVPRGRFCPWYMETMAPK